MRTRKLPNAMPYNLRKIEVFNPLAVHMNLESPDQLRDPLQHAPLRAVLLVEKRGNHCQARLVLHGDTGRFLFRITTGDGPQYRSQFRKNDSSILFKSLTQN